MQGFNRRLDDKEMLNKIKILLKHGKQYIPDLTQAELPVSFHGGVPVISSDVAADYTPELKKLCPTGAISAAPLSIDLGRCIFCNECAMRYPEAIKFTTNYKIAANVRENLVVTAGEDPRLFDPDRVRAEIKKTFGRALRLRQVCAGGDGSTEMELGASLNVNFDFIRYGIDFVASPRHADGIVITGPITRNMAVPLELCYNAIAKPKIVILAGTDAISGGLFAGSGAIDRSFLDRFPADLYIPGNPVHPLSFIHGVMQLIGQEF